MSISKLVRILGLLVAIVQATALAQPAVQYHKLSKKQLKALIASAKTPADHEAIAAYYHTKAQHFWAKYRKEEAALAEYYRNPIGYPSKYPTVGDIDRSLAGSYEMTAERAAAMEAMQEKLARQAKWPLPASNSGHRGCLHPRCRGLAVQQRGRSWQG